MNPSIFAVKMFVLVVLVFGFEVAIIRMDAAIKLLCQFVVGLLFAHATELVHQCIHRTATGSAPVDHTLGILLGMPSGTSFWHYLWFHFRHHKLTGSFEDIESFGYSYQLMESPSRRRRILGFLWHLSMVSHYLTALKRMLLATAGRLSAKLAADFPDIHPRVAANIQRDYAIMAVLLAAALLATVAFETKLFVDLWLVPLLIGWGPSHALIELPEHFQCDKPASDAWLNTRSIQAGRLARWLTNFNCNHVGHHHNMAVAMEELPRYEQTLAEQHPFKHLEPSYPQFYLRFAKFLFTGRFTKNGAGHGSSV
ncbi:MAG TPA: fatty acid desaturase [Blastocatellia bacterium]|nr:fatty acid desaturase [Blastocatellia bacterium]